MARSVRLSPDEAWATLEAAHTGVFTSLRRDGVPVTLAVWFVALDRRIYTTGPAARKKNERVRHDPRVSFLVESGDRWAELRGVSLTGRARLVTEPELLARVTEALHAKYDSFRSPRASMPDATRGAYEVEMATIEITPDDRILSWDNSRIELGT